MKKLILFGTGAFARLACYYFTTDSPYTVVGFTVDRAFLREPTFEGHPVVAFDEVERQFPPDTHDMFVAAGIRQVNGFRAAKVTEAEAKGYRLAGFLSTRAGVSPGQSVRPNTMIMEWAWIHPFVEIGRDTIIWSASRVAFGTHIGDHCWVVGALLGESVKVGDFSFIGLGATIAPSVSIGPRNIIGAGALIVKDTNDSEVYRAVASTPSRVPSHRVRLDH